MTLVEPKKGGRSFREIINAEDTQVTLNSNTHMMSSKAPTNAPPVNAWMNAAAPTFRKNDESQQFVEQKQRQLELESIRSRAAAAEAQLDRERKKVEAAMEKKRKEETEKEALKLQEQQRILKEQQEQERKRLEIEQIKAEIAKREEQARIKQEQERIKRENEEKLKQQQLAERLRKKREAAEAARLEQLHREKIEELQDRIHRQRIIRAKALIKRKLTPCLDRVRQRIQKRNEKALERRRMWHFNLCLGIQNPYSSLNISMLRPLHSTPEGIRERVSKCMQYEKYALDNVKQVRLEF